LTVVLAKKLKSEVTVFHVVTHELMRSLVKDFLVRGEALPETADSKPAAMISSDAVLSRERPTSPGAHYSERIEDELTSVYRQQGENVVADAALSMKEEGVIAERKVVENKSVVEAVMEEAEREDYDLIVLGRSGQKEKEKHLGSVAEKVSRQSEIPVLIAGERRKIAKLLVPVDGSKSSGKALKYAAALTKEFDADLTLLHVQESHLFGLRPELTRAIGKGVLADAADELKGMKFEKRLESGDPANKITEIAEKEDYDIIVMGSKGHSALGRFFLGSVINHVLHYTHHPVLVVK